MLSAFKNFGVTFLIAALIFSIAAYFATRLVTNTMSDIMSSEKEELHNILSNEENSPLSPDVQDDPNEAADRIEGKSFSFLLIVTDFRPDVHGDYLPTDVQALNEKSWSLTDQKDAIGYLSKPYRNFSASAVVLVRADKESQQYTYTYFSPESRVYTSTGYHTLGEVYNYYGADTVKEYVNALTGIRPTYSFVVNGYNLDELAEVVGPVTVNLSKDVYSDEKGIYTTQYEFTRDAIGEDGMPYVEHVPNTYVLGTGNVELNGDYLYILSSLEERSTADLAMKEAYTVEAVRQYLAKLAALDDAQLKIVLSQLLLPESEWTSIEGLDYTPPEEETETESETTEENNPWWNNMTNDETETTGEGETESGEEGEGGDETEEEVFLYEPENPILESSDFTAASLDEELKKVSGVLRAVGTFENLMLSYPGSYVPAAAEEEAYFEPDLKTGVARFLAYRESAVSSNPLSAPSTQTTQPAEGETTPSETESDTTAATEQ